MHSFTLLEDDLGTSNSNNYHYKVLTGMFFSNGVETKCWSMLEAPFKNLQSKKKKDECQLRLLRRFLLDLET